MMGLETLFDLLFPPHCPFCGAIQDHPGICPKCADKLPRAEGKDGLREGAGYGKCAFAVYYEGDVRESLLHFKFGGKASWADIYARELLVPAVVEHLSGEFDCLTWVPVSRRRLRRRGYDQARLLAQGGSGRRRRCSCCASGGTTPPSQGSRMPLPAGPMCWESTRRWTRGRSPDGGYCSSTTSSPPAAPWRNAAGCSVLPARRRWSAPRWQGAAREKRGNRTKFDVWVQPETKNYIEKGQSAKNVLANPPQRHYNKQCITVRGSMGEIPASGL